MWRGKFDYDVRWDPGSKLAHIQYSSSNWLINAWTAQLHL